MCLPEGHNALTLVRLEPTALQSRTQPLHSLNKVCNKVMILSILGKSFVLFDIKCFGLVHEILVPIAYAQKPFLNAHADI